MPESAVAERTLPHNLEAERSVLGAVLLHNDAFNLAAAGRRDSGMLVLEPGETLETAAVLTQEL